MHREKKPDQKGRLGGSSKSYFRNYHSRIYFGKNRLVYPDEGSVHNGSSSKN